MMARHLRRRGWLVDEGLDRGSHCGVEIADDPAVVDELDQRPSRNAKAAAEAHHRQPVDITSDEVGCEPIRERPTDAQNAGGLVDREHCRQAIEVAFGVSGGFHGKLEVHPCDSRRNPQ